MFAILFDKKQGLEIQIAFILSCLLMAAFFVAPALMSITMGGLLIIGLLGIKLFWNELKSNKTLMIVSVLSALLLLVHLNGWFISENFQEGQRKFFLKLPFFLSPLLWLIFNRFNIYQKIIILLVFIYYVYLGGTISTFVYFRLRDYFDPLILEAKPIPILFGYGIYHIQYSILNAVASLAGLYLLIKQRQLLGKPLFLFVLFLTVINIANLHILTARTGLLSFYCGIGVAGISYFFKSRNTKLLKYFPFLILTPIVAYFFSTSLQNRVTNSMEDFNTIINSENPNDKSVAMRVEAWRVSYHLIKKYPVMGVGLGDLDKELQLQYIESKTLLTEFNRKNPHNQFLESTLHTGIIGGILLLTLFIVLVVISWRSPVVLGIIIVWVSSMFFESMLERQVSIMAITFFIGFFIYLPKQKNAE